MLIRAEQEEDGRGEGHKMGSIQEDAESFALGVSSTDKDVQIPLYAFMC